MRLINAALSLLSAHLSSPWEGTRSMSSYEGWCSLVGACVERFTGVSPIASQDTTGDLGNGAEEVADALAALAAKWPGAGRQAATVGAAWIACPLELRALYLAQYPRARAADINPALIARLFRTLHGRPLGGHMLTRGDDLARQRTWIIVTR